METFKKLLPVFILIAAGLFVYAPSLTGDFIWDDHILIEKNYFIKSFSYLPQIFSENLPQHLIDLGPKNQPFNFYRPLQILTYLFDYKLWKLNAFGYHLTNIIWHIFAVISLYLFLQFFLKKRLLSFISAMLFLIHPANTESVNYLSGRGDSIAFFFFMVSLLFYFKACDRNNWKFVFLSVFLYVLSLFSKEQSFILPAIVLLYHFSFRKRLKLGYFFPYVLTFSLYVAFRKFVIVSMPVGPKSFAEVMLRLPGFFSAVVSYLRIIILPVNLHMEHLPVPLSFNDFKVGFGVLLLVTLIIAAIYLRKAKPIFSFAIGWFLITLIPVSNLLAFTPFYMAEHYLYFPLVGAIIALIFGIRKYIETDSQRRPVVIILLFLFFFYSALTIKQHDYWQDEVSFNERILSYSPNSYRVNLNMGRLSTINCDYQQALKYYNRAIQIYPDLGFPYNNLGVVYQELGMFDKAILCYIRALRLEGLNSLAGRNFARLNQMVDLGYEANEIGMADSANFVINLNLAGLYKQIGQLDQAIDSYKKALEINPRRADVYFHLACIYYDQKKYSQAIELFEDALRIKPDYSAAYLKLGQLYYKSGDEKKVAEIYNRAFANLPKDYKILQIRANQKQKEQKYSEALSLYLSAIDANPYSASLYNQAGMLYYQLSSYSEALKMYNDAKSLKPKDPDIYYNLGLLYQALMDADRAFESYNEAITLNPKHGPSYNNLAVLFFLTKDYPKAVKYADLAVRYGVIIDESFEAALDSYRD
ncbi:MAG: tetratricopeptide repeat protein [Candidatus Omnitrophica bacterium]|nr:tetratricopeptide repeat protein [Candidatus Omnitrophota bacterium]